MKTIMSFVESPKECDVPQVVIDGENVVNDLNKNNNNINVKHIVGEEDIENKNLVEYSSKVCYDNPIFIEVFDNHLNNSYQQNDIVMNTSNNHNITNDNMDKSTAPDDSSKERTLSISSIKHYLPADRRYSRRLSICQRKADISTGGEPDDNPLRRRMSFIKDTSGADEPLGKTATQILIASLCAGFGNVGAGVVINLIQDWKVFIDIKTMFILIPSLLGLKGNLEMTMASRLSTEANMGHMDKWPKTLRMIGGDMALVQCQATVVSLLAAIVALIIQFCQTQTFHLDHILVVIATSLLTANIACLCLGFIMAFVIVFSNKVDIDPDNIATPIAASLGDVSTAGFYALFAQWIYIDSVNRGSSAPVLAIAVIIVFLILLPVFYIIARKNDFTHNLVHSGWCPIVAAMLISSGGGFFLDSAVQRFDKLPPFQPVICGVGGNLVAVAASKISTRLHMHSKLGTLPFGIGRVSSPLRVFWNQRDLSTKLCLLLLLMAIPLHLLYSIVIWVIQRDTITLTAPLILLYIAFAAAQVFILLNVGYNLVHILWSYSINPDMSAIPLLTALGDLLGSAFLLCVFIILDKLKDPNAVLIQLVTHSGQAFNVTTLSTNITTF